MVAKLAAPATTGAASRAAAEAVAVKTRRRGDAVKERRGDAVMVTVSPRLNFSTSPGLRVPASPLLRVPFPASLRRGRRLFA